MAPWFSLGRGIPDPCASSLWSLCWRPRTTKPKRPGCQEMQLAIAADHGGYELKALLVPWLNAAGHQVVDLGAHQLDPDDDYPDYAAAVAQEVQSGGAERGIVVCGSGVGACIAANKVPGIRACLCHDTYTGHQGVEHDDMNVICLGARIIGVELAKEILHAFLSANFIPEPRFRRRLEKLLKLEQQGIGKIQT